MDVGAAVGDWETGDEELELGVGDAVPVAVADGPMVEPLERPASYDAPTAEPTPVVDVELRLAPVDDGEGA